MALSRSRNSNCTQEKQLSKRSLKNSKSLKSYITSNIKNESIYYLTELADSLNSPLAEEININIRENENYAYTEEEDLVDIQDLLTKQELYDRKFLSHYHHCLQSIAYINTLEKLNEDDFVEKKVYLPPKSHKSKKTLILDLDETLVHCDEDLTRPKQLQLPIKFTGGEVV
jgi:CTD small phosphatase-like protein 2